MAPMTIPSTRRLGDLKSYLDIVRFVHEAIGKLTPVRYPHLSRRNPWEGF